MNEPITDESTPQDSEFPSPGFLIRLYGAGAILALVFSFALPLDPVQITGCLAVSWLLTTGALTMAIHMEEVKHQTDD
ncbi:MAG: hypothetical protein KDD44_08315 [Bdellovibrionales bacterium]|nr:hypothetical protein [Bdellovibrionales bacterium]